MLRPVLLSGSRGVFRITNRGRDLLALNLPKLTVKDLKRYPEFAAFRRGSVGGTTVPEDDAPMVKTETPQEQLENAYRALRDTLGTTFSTW